MDQRKKKCGNCFLHDYNTTFFELFHSREAWIRVLETYIALAEKKRATVENLQLLYNALKFDIINHSNLVDSLRTNDDDDNNNYESVRKQILKYLKKYKPRRYSV